MRRSRAPSNWPGPFFAARSWAGCTTNMFGFDLRQAQVKLARVMMLGPVVAGIAIFSRGLRSHRPTAPGGIDFFKVVPWFIIMFFVFAGLRSLSLIPNMAVG